MTRHILFLCPHAAAKSVMASALAARAIARLELDCTVDAAGTEPDPGPMPEVVALLAEEGLDVSAHRPRRVTREDLAGAFRVISLGCEPAELPDPHVALERWDDVPLPSRDLAGARRRIGARVDALIDALAAGD